MQELLNNKLKDILYYDLSEKKNAQLKKGLNEYRLLLCALEAAIYSLENGDFERFDSLVGENACQIRAVKIAMLAAHGQLNFNKLKGEITALKNKIDELLSEERISSLMSSDISLEEVLEQEEIKLPLNSDEMFILKSFLLSEMKAPQPEGTEITSLVRIDKSSPKNLKQFGEASSSFAFNTGRKLRRLLSEASVDFVREMASQTGDGSLIEMASEKYTHIHNEAWPCLPMFWTYKILLETSLKEGIPLIIHAKFLNQQGETYQLHDEEILFFKPVQGEQGSSYVLVEPDEIDFNMPACVVEGILVNDHFCKLKWKDEIAKSSIVDVILAGAADHRQYPDPNMEVQIDDSEYEGYIAMAKEKGFSIDNPSTFFINHVYPAQVGRIAEFRKAEQGCVAQPSKNK